MMPEWVYDLRSARYRDLETGRYVSSVQVRKWADEAIDASAEGARGLASLLATDRLALGDWQGMMREGIKEQYVAQYIAGRGGIEQMTQTDWGSVGGMLREQYRYLDGFAREVAAGNLTEGQIAARSRMYFNSSREAYERAQERTRIVAGFDEVLWVVDSGAENCKDCLDFAAMGWQPVQADPFHGAKPGSGDTRCLTNCRCRLDYRRT
jgi:hypothetical protein